MTESKPEIIKARDVAEILGCNYKTVLRLLDDGVIPGVKAGNSWRVAKSVVYASLGLDPDGTPLEES